MISLPRLSLNMKPGEKNLKEPFFQIITETHLRCGVVWEVQHKRILFLQTVSVPMLENDFSVLVPVWEKSKYIFCLVCLYQWLNVTKYIYSGAVLNFMIISISTPSQRQILTLCICP